MKYIRTKYGTIELNIESIEREIVDQADTIEELCDEFVYVNDNVHDFLVSDDLEKAKAKFYDNNVYGAIWTDKGLIYIAKMNDKGELELL